MRCGRSTSGKRLMPPEVADRLSDYLANHSSRREVEGYVGSGLANKEIAGRLGTASGTIKMHIQNILEKLGAADRTHVKSRSPFERGIRIRNLKAGVRHMLGAGRFSRYRIAGHTGIAI